MVLADLNDLKEFFMEYLRKISTENENYISSKNEYEK